MTSKIKILIVDDSKVIQKLLYAVLSKESDFEIVGICADPFEAKDYISNGQIDCMILDLEMPKMDGLTFLKKLQHSHPIKTIILSSAVDSNPQLLETLIAHGAHAVFSKPNGVEQKTFIPLIQAVRSEYKIGFNLATKKNDIKNPSRYLLIASSTGGTEGVKKILKSLNNHNDLTIIIVQHMGANFTKTFADSLDKQSEFHVKEADHNEILEAGIAYVAPGNYHLEIIKSDFKQYSLITNQNPPMHSVRPAADVTFLNFPQQLISNCTAIVLSGMGKDGAEGIAYLNKNGAHTIAEAESSCVVFGMPKAAIQTGHIDVVLSIDEICIYLQNKFGYSQTA